jgi:topoisomerase-4 subunit B
LGEISPDEFSLFIGADMRKTLMRLEHGDHIQQLLEYYMGKKHTEEAGVLLLRIKN